MKKILMTLAALCGVWVLCAQPVNEKPSVLLSVTKRATLEAPPYDSWFRNSYDNYNPDKITMDSLMQISKKDITVEIFFGSWCGDSKRELPRFLKILDQYKFPAAGIRIIGLGNADSLYKKSPLHEEEGKDIIRVPVFIFYHKGTEINRIIEYPVVTLEKDMLAILSGRMYVPNYRKK